MSTKGGNHERSGRYLGNFKGRDQLEDIKVEGRIILKVILKECSVCGLG
jgi:hypothetical protein